MDIGLKKRVIGILSVIWFINTPSIPLRVQLSDAYGHCVILAPRSTQFELQRNF